MAELSSAHLALLEQITDPMRRAIVDAREAMTELSSEIVALKEAVDADGDDARDWLSYLAMDAETAVERLAELIEVKR